MSFTGTKKSDDQHLRADGCHAVQFFDVLVVKPDTSVRRPTPDLARVVCAVNSVVCPTQVHRVGSQGVVRPGTNIVRPLGIPFLHRGGWTPLGSFDLAHNFGASTTGQIFADRNAGRIQLVGIRGRIPKVQRPRRQIDKDCTLTRVVEIRLPVQRTKARRVPAHRLRHLIAIFHFVLRESRNCRHGCCPSQETPAVQVQEWGARQFCLQCWLYFARHAT